MKIALRALKLFFAFLCLSFGSLQILEARKHGSDVSDNALLVVSAILAIGLTILWMEWKKN
jgi:uncharacterized membrane protein